jgi:hypothetical protein
MSGYARGAAARSLWQERLSSFEASGLSVKKFCEGGDFSVASFYQWRQRLAAQASGVLVTQPAFRPVQVVGTGDVVSVDFPGIGVLRVSTAQLDAVRAVVRELAAASGTSPRC